MRHGSLFSGGGGFDLAAEMVGWQNVFHCEKDEFCQTVLEHYWPDADSIGDIKEFDGSRYCGTIDIISGGFPCQPFSAAGKRQGTADDRYLWPEMLRVIKQVKPRWVVGENVYGLLNWNEGLVFDTVQAELEDAGYEVTAFVLPAAGINAPHQRYRVWIVGYNDSCITQRAKEDHSDAYGAGRNGTRPCRETTQGRECRQCKLAECLCASELATLDPDTNHNGCQRRNGKDEKLTGKDGQYAQHHPLSLGKHAAYSHCKRSPLPEKVQKMERPRPRFSSSGTEWNNWPAQSPLCGGDDGLPTELDGITFSKWKNQSVKLYGNAIVPQVALRIFKAIQAFETAHTGMPVNS